MNRSIEIGVGFGGLRFGFTTRDVQHMLGFPDESEILDQATKSTESVYYRNHKLQLIFQFNGIASHISQELRRLTQCTTRHPASTLWDQTIVGRPMDEIAALFKSRGFDPIIEDDHSTKLLGYKLLRYDSLGVLLDFRHGLLISMTWRDVNLSGGLSSR